MRTAGIIDVSMPKVISTLTVRVRFARLAGARIWLAARLIALAALVAGCGIEILDPDACGRSEAG